MPKTTQRHFCHVFCHVSSFLASKELTSWGGQLQLSEESVACRGSALEEGYLSMKRPLARFETWATGLQKLPFAGSFCDTTCNHAWVKPFASICSEKVGRLYHISRPVLLKCKGAVQQKPRYFPTPVLLKILKKRQQLAKRLGVGRCRKAWKRTHTTQHTATKVADAGVKADNLWITLLCAFGQWPQTQIASRISQCRNKEPLCHQTSHGPCTPWKQEGETWENRVGWKEHCDASNMRRECSWFDWKTQCYIFEERNDWLKSWQLEKNQLRPRMFEKALRFSSPERETDLGLLLMEAANGQACFGTPEP